MRKFWKYIHPILPNRQVVLKTLKSVPAVTVGSVVVLLLGTYGVWCMQRYFSPIQSGGDADIGVIATLKTSDHDRTKAPLQNPMTPTDQADYANYDGDIPLSFNDGFNRFNFFRIDGALLYYYPTGVQNISSIAQLTFELPSLTVAMPKQLMFRGVTYTFDKNIPCFKVSSVCEPTIVVTTITNDDPNNTLDDRYSIIIKEIKPSNKSESTGTGTPDSGFLPGVGVAKAYSPPPASTILALLKRPYPIRMTFEENAAANNVLKIKTYLSGNATANAKIHQYLGNSVDSCVVGTNFDNALCLKPEIKLKVSVTNTVTNNTKTYDFADQWLTERLGQGPGQIIVNGNVGANGTAGGFTIGSPNAIAYGGNVNGVAGADLTKLNNYLINSGLKWTGGVGDKIVESVAKSITKATNDAGNYQWNGSGSINLNNGSNLLSGTATSTTFTTPPEGRLWYLSNMNGLRIGGDLSVSGSGTIIVNGNVYLNKVICAPGTRLGIIAYGDITLYDSVGCGAFVAISSRNANPPRDNGYGSISMTNRTSSSSMSGIFIAQMNINLPQVFPRVVLRIDYDSFFATNPTVIFREVLKILGLTTIS